VKQGDPLRIRSVGNVSVINCIAGELTVSCSNPAATIAHEKIVRAESSEYNLWWDNLLLLKLGTAALAARRQYDQLESWVRNGQEGCLRKPQQTEPRVIVGFFVLIPKQSLLILPDRLKEIRFFV
jgi:hypothetical protein